MNSARNLLSVQKTCTRNHRYQIEVIASRTTLQSRQYMGSKDPHAVGLVGMYIYEGFGRDIRGFGISGEGN